LLLLQNIDGK